MEVPGPSGTSDQCHLLSEATLKANMRIHRPTILKYLTPSHPTLYEILEDFECSDSQKTCSDHEMADILLKKVEEEGDYHKFLTCLENDSNEHLGHTHIARLLRGEEFSDKEKANYDESTKIAEKMKADYSFIIETLNVRELLPLLRSHNLLTNNDEQEMQLHITTSQHKATRFLTLLRAKGPRAHHIFLHKCLAEERQHSGHKELHDKILSLAEESPKPNRKRKASQPVSGTPEKIPKSIRFIPIPDGIVAKCYVAKITEIRQFSDPDYSKRRLKVEIDYVRNSPESRIAFCLEMSYYFVTDLKRTRQFVSKAKKLYKEFEISIQNPSILEARWKLVLGRCLYKCGQHKQATNHLNSALAILSTFEKGEDCMLAYYFQACSMMKSEGPIQWKRIIVYLSFVIEGAEEQTYGMDIDQFSQIRLAQAYLHLTADNPVSDMDFAAEDMQRAKDLLRHLEDKYTNMKPAAKCFYLMARSDVSRLSENFPEAKIFAEQALQASETTYHRSLIEKRLNLLK